MDLFKRSLVSFIIFTLVLSLVGAVGLAPKEAKAAVTAMGPYDLILSGGQSVPASSFDTPILRFSLTQSASETLSSVTVTIVNNTAGAVTNDTLASHIDTLEVWKDANGNNFFDHQSDVLAGSQATVNVATSTTAITVSSNNTLASSGGLATTFFVTINTTAGWAVPDSILVNMAANGIATSANSPTVAALTGTNSVFAGAGGGGGGGTFGVEKATFVNSTTVDVVFTDMLDTFSGGGTTSTANYTLTTANGGDNSTVTSVIVLPDNKSVRVAASGAVISSAGTDTIAVSANVRSSMGIANSMTMATMILSGTQPLIISEIKVGAAGDEFDEFIEFYNRSSEPLATTSTVALRLHLVNAAGTVDVNVPLTFINSATSVQPHGFFLVAPVNSPASSSADAVYTTSTLRTLLPNGAAYISNSTASSSAIIDKVCWGSQGVTANCEGQSAGALTNNGGSIERKAFNGSTSASMAAGGADVNMGNGTDTQNNSYDFVSQSTPVPQNRSSAVETPSGGSYGGANNMAPDIDLAPLFRATASSTLNLIARISDDGGPLQPGNTNLIFCTTNTTCTPASSTPIYGTSIGNGWFKFSSTTTDAWSSNRSKFMYYLQATDSAAPAKTSVFTIDSNYDDVTFDHTTDGIPSAALQQSKAFTMDLVQGNMGSASISGYVYNMSNQAVSGVTIWIEGTQFAITSGNDGAFSFSNVGPAGGATLKFAKDGYVDLSVSFYLPASGLVSLATSTLNSGTMGGGGDFNQPMITTTFPGLGSNMFSPQSPTGGAPSIDLNFSKSMDTTTITDTDASNAGSNIYLTLAGQATKIAGAVTAPSATQARFTPTSALTAGQAYTLFVTSGVKDTVGNPVSGNSPGGNYILSFSTAGQFFSNTSEITSFGTGNSFPPFVVGGQPSPGKINVATNSKGFISFSEELQNTSANLAMVKLYKVTNSYTASEAKALVSTTNSLDASGKMVILSAAAALDASSKYRMEVLGGIMSAKGIPLGNPTQSGFATNVAYKSDFDTGAGTDTTAPTVDSTSPAASATGASTIKPVVITFSEAINPTTVTASSVSLKLGSTAVAGDLTYNPNSWTATFVPNYALTASSTYTISVTTTTKDLAGNALDQDSGTGGSQGLSRTFTTGSADLTSPTVNSAQANDFAVKVSFSKPMLAVPSGDLNYANSVLNPSNYTIRVVNSSGAVQSAVTLPATATLTYDSATRSVAINGLPAMGGFTAGSTLMNIVVSTNSKDIAFNNLPAGAQAATTTAQSSSMTGNFSFGGGMGMGMPMMDAAGSVMQGGMFGPEQTSFKSFTDSGISFIPSVKVFPFSPMAGVATIYGVEIPISQQIPNGGFIDITFPEGTDVSLAKKDTDSPPNTDLNGPGPGTVVFATSEGTLPSGWSTGGVSSDGVIVNSTSPIVRVILGSVATRCGTGNTSPCTAGNDTHDFLRLDLAGLLNPSTVTKAGTSGNSATVETKKSDGTVIETLSSGSYFMNAAGTLEVRGRLLFDATGLNGASVFLMSPMTGAQTTSTANNRYGGADGEFRFQNLVAGMYMLGVERVFKVGGTTYTSDFPIPVNVNATNCASSICTKNISVTNASTGALVTLSISGVFSNDAVDIFAGGPGSFRMATTTLNGTLTNNTDNTIRLNANGVWMVGFGPGMSIEMFGKSGPSRPTNWMVPRPQEVQVAGCPSGCVANPATVSFNVSAANKTVKFTVRDGSGNGIGGAQVFAYSPTGGLGTDVDANADGTGSVNLSYGTYKIGANVQGMPGGLERSIAIRSVSGTDKVFIDGSTTGITLSSMAVGDLILTIDKPSYTISGKVTDGTNPVAQAPVTAYRTNGPGHANTFTNSAGAYTLYVSNGIWKVQAFLPDYGKLPEKTITVSGANVSGQDFEPNTASINYGTLTKSIAVDSNGDSSYVAVDDEELANVQVIVEGTTSGGETYVNTALTDTNGSSTLKMPPGTYTMKAWSPKLGELPAFSSNVVVNSAGVVTTEPSNLLAPQTANVTVNLLDSAGVATTTLSKAVVELSLIGGKIDKTESFDNVASSTMVLPIYDAGTDGQANGKASSTSPNNLYAMRVSIPGVSSANISVYGESGTIMATSTTVTGMWKLEIDGNETIDVRLPDLKNVSGTVKNDVGTAIADAVVHIENTSTGETVEVKADSSGNYSTKLSSGTYLVQADKDGYVDTATTVTVSTSTALADNLTTMTTASLTIGGTITVAGSAASGATVRAEKLGGGIVTATTNTSGVYSLQVMSGDWKVSAAVDGYTEASYGNGVVVSVSSSNVSGIDINLTTTKSGLSGTNSSSVTPQTGGAFSDNSASLSVNAPATSIAHNANSYSMSDKETSNIVGGGSGTPISGEAKSMTSYDNSGNSVTILNDDVAVSASYSTTDLDSSISGSLTVAKLEKVKMSSWDDTSDNWENLPTTVAYKNSSGNFVEPQTDLSNVATVAYTGQTSHLTVFNPTDPSDGLSPSAPTGLTASSGGTNTANLSWTAPTTNSDGTSLSDLLGYEVYRSTSSGGTYTQINTSDVSGTTYTDSNATAGQTYYYKVTAADTGGLESSLSSASSGVTPAAPVTSGGGGGGVPTPTPTPTPAVVIPSNLSISINAGAVDTTERAATVTLGATNAAYMMVSEKSDLSGAAWEAYSASKALTLSEGYGVKTVYVKFKSSTDGVSELKSDTIVLLAKPVSATVRSAETSKIAVAEGKLDVSFPAGSLASDATLSATPASTYSSMAGKSLIGSQVYDLKAAVGGTTVSQFSKDVELTFKYADAEVKGLAESTLAVYWWDEAKSAWVKLGGTVDTTNNKVTVKTNHFTVFALFGDLVIDPNIGKLVKLKCDAGNKAICSAVYYIGKDGKRYVFPNEKIYFTWYKDFTDVKEISATELASYLIGGNATYKPGVRMVKIQSDPKVYAVAKGGLLRWVKDEVLAKALYGTLWNKMIDDLPDSFFFSYKITAPIAATGDYDKTAATAGSPDINTDKDL